MTNKTLDFVCDGMENGGRFPVEHTGRGRDASPGFSIRNLSPEAKTLAVTLEDLSHPVKNFTHWVIWNIPAGGQSWAGPVRASDTAFTGTPDRSRLKGKRILTALPCTHWTVKCG